MTAEKKKKARFEMVCEQEFLDRLRENADRLGLGVSAYVRLRLTEAMNRDEKQEQKEGE